MADIFFGSALPPWHRQAIPRRICARIGCSQPRRL